jgi:hypothetical protein
MASLLAMTRCRRGLLVSTATPRSSGRLAGRSSVDQRHVSTARQARHHRQWRLAWRPTPELGACGTSPSLPRQRRCQWRSGEFVERACAESLASFTRAPCQDWRGAGSGGRRAPQSGQISPHLPRSDWQAPASGRPPLHASWGSTFWIRRFAPSSLRFWSPGRCLATRGAEVDCRLRRSRRSGEDAAPENESVRRNRSVSTRRSLTTSR